MPVASVSCGSSDSLMSNIEMILRRFMIAFSMVIACALAWTNTGCRDNQPPQASAADAQATPEASFKEIVRLVKDGVDLHGVGTSTGFVAKDDRASSRFQVNNEVTSELIPPTDGSTNYRGTITVTSSSTYSLRRSAEDSNSEKEQDQSAKDNGFSLMDDPDADAGFHSMDDQLVSPAPSGETSGGSNIESVQRRTAEDVRDYELAYENNHWVLKTKFDPETETSIAKAFERALRMQP